MTRHKWTPPIRAASNLHTSVENVDDEPDSHSAGSSQEAVVNEPGTTARAKMKLQAFRFR